MTGQRETNVCVLLEDNCTKCTYIQQVCVINYWHHTLEVFDPVLFVKVPVEQSCI